MGQQPLSARDTLRHHVTDWILIILLVVICQLFFVVFFFIGIVEVKDGRGPSTLRASIVAVVIGLAIRILPLL